MADDEAQPNWPAQNEWISRVIAISMTMGGPALKWLASFDLL